jgi:hypothetical protein
MSSRYTEPVSAHRPIAADGLGGLISGFEGMS